MCVQCVIPCIAGLLPEPYNGTVLELVYIVMHWHALAKLHMHTDSSLAVLDSTTTLLGTRLRQFATDCESLDVRETQRSTPPANVQLFLVNESMLLCSLSIRPALV